MSKNEERSGSSAAMARWPRTAVRALLVFSAAVLASSSPRVAFGASATLEVYKPLSGGTFTVTFTLGDTVVNVPVTIEATDSQITKRNAIRDALVAKGFTVTTPSDGKLKINGLSPAMKVKTDQGKTAEREDKAKAQNLACGRIDWGGTFGPLDPNGFTSIFVAGVSTDAGSMTATLDADDILSMYGDLSAQSVASASYNELLGNLPAGASMSLTDASLDFTFDPLMTQVEGGEVVFGTTASGIDTSVAGSLTFVPEPGTLAVLAFGAVAVLRRKRR